MSVWRPSLFPRRTESGRRLPARIHPPRLLIESFIVLIGVGAALLKLPIATHDPVTWLEAAFTATSAVTVTGLTVVETGSQFTLFGQIVILLLIQLGGLGLMTFAVLTAAALGFNLGLSMQRVSRHALNQVSMAVGRRTWLSIATFALVVESIGLMVLAIFFVPEKGWQSGLYHALFYSISGFNNAGFSLSADSVGGYASSAGISLTVSILFIIGGLGYIVARELYEKRSFSRLSFYSRIILIATVLFNLAAMIGFFLLEHDNPHTLGQLEGIGEKFLAAWFQGTTPRTAGFHTVDISMLGAGTSVMMLLLMFIGGAPNSTASGIKLTTFFILIAATRSFLRGHLKVGLFHRSIASEAVLKALAITTMAMATVGTGIFVLTVSVKADFLDLTFEVFSAFGTVGLSRGATEQLGSIGQITIMAIMLLGRVGPLTLGYILARRTRSRIRYPETSFPVG